MKAQKQDFAVIGRDFQERELHGLLVLARNQHLQWRKGVLVGGLEGLVAFRIAKIFEAGNFFAARNVDDQIARNGEKPRFELGFGVVLVASLEDANPRFLEKVFGDGGVAREEEKVTVEAMLVLLNEAIKEVGIAAAKSIGEGLGVVRHETGE